MGKNGKAPKQLESVFITEKFDLIHPADPLIVDADLKGSSKD